MERIFYKTGVDISSVKSMFKFLSGHFKHYAPGSCNKEKSYANDVKLYNLKIDEYDQAYAISKFEDEHPGYRVGFNGVSDGYLVLYADGGDSAIPCWLDFFDEYEDWKAYEHRYSGSVGHYKDELQALVKVVRDFDLLCDKLADIVRNR